MKRAVCGMLLGAYASLVGCEVNPLTETVPAYQAEAMIHQANQQTKLQEIEVGLLEDRLAKNFFFIPSRVNLDLHQDLESIYGTDIPTGTTIRFVPSTELTEIFNDIGVFETPTGVPLYVYEFYDEGFCEYRRIVTRPEHNGGVYSSYVQSDCEAPLKDRLK